MPKPLSPSERADKFMLRMPDGMREEMAAAAQRNGRSMNSEIVQRLAESLFMDRQTGGADTTGIEDPKLLALVEKIEQAIDRKFLELGPNPKPGGKRR